MNFPQLTTLEVNALQAAYNEASGNGFDFGVVECISWDGDRKALGALLKSLQSKKIIAIHAPERINGESYYRRDRRAPGGYRIAERGGHIVTQYTFPDGVLDAIATFYPDMVK